MNGLLRWLGSGGGEAYHRVVSGQWHVERPLSPAVLTLLVLVGLALAAMNFLPAMRMRPAVRVGTFCLRLALLGLLMVVASGLEWHGELQKLQPQQWVALVDDSASMNTRDVEDQSRYAAALADYEKLRAAVDGKLELSLRTFSGNPPAQEQAGLGPTLFRSAVSTAALSRGQVDRLIVLSDGRDSQRRDLYGLGEDLRARDIRLAVRVYGSTSPPADVGIVAEPERNLIRLGEELVVRGAVLAPQGEGEHLVALKEDGREVGVSAQVSLRDGGRFELRWRPKKKGKRTFTVELQASDHLAQNNQASFTVDVVEEKIRVLLVEGFPRFEFKLMKTVLEVDPLVHLVCISHVPGGGVYVQGEPLHRNPEEGLIGSPAELFKYDVVILRDLARQYFLAGGDTSESRLRYLVDFVTKRGGGLMVCGGQDVYRAGNYQDSHLAEILPFDLSDAISGQDQFDGMFFVSIPKPAYDHPLLRLLPDASANRQRLESLRQLDGSNNVGRFKPLATPLLTRALPQESTAPASPAREVEVPIMGYQAVGEGKVLAAAVDTLWRWQLQPEFDDPPLTMLLANAVRYLAPPPGRAPGAPNVSFADGTPQVGQDLVLSTELRDRNFDPITAADLVVTVQRPDGGTFRMYPRDLPEEPGHYEYRVAIDQPGPYKVTARYGTFEATREFLAGAAAGEFADLSVDRAGIQRFLDGAQGEWIDEVDAFLRAVDVAPKSVVVQRDLEFWNSPLVLALFVALVSLDCYLRKRQGLA